MTLGCGGYGGNITSDNISPMHLLNIKRLAYEVTPAAARAHTPAAGPALPKAPAEPVQQGVSADSILQLIDQVLSSRGVPAAAPAPPPTPTAARPVDFVCEEDVRQAIKKAEKILVGARTIITPAARDLGDQHKVFTPVLIDPSALKG